MATTIPQPVEKVMLKNRYEMVSLNGLRDSSCFRNRDDNPQKFGLTAA